jgi:hypothetical protein
MVRFRTCCGGLGRISTVLTCYVHIFLLPNKMAITQSSFSQVLGRGALTGRAFIRETVMVALASPEYFEPAVL